MIDSMFQAGTQQALADQVKRPRPAAPPPPPGFSFGDLAAAPFQGLSSGAAKSMAFGAEIMGAFGDVMGAYPELYGPVQLDPNQRKQANEARDRLLKEGPRYSNDVGDSLRQRSHELMPDAATTHVSAQITAGLFEFGSQAVGYTLAAGPVVGATVLGGDVAMSEADRLKQQGVDLGTRTKAGAAAGAIAGASVLVPMSGATAAGRFLKGAAAGEAGIVGTAAAEKVILEHGGYSKLADQFDPFDPVGLAVGLVPGALGAKFGKPRAPIKTDADVRRVAALTPEEQARSDQYERSAGNLAELEAAVKAEKNPANRALLEAELAKQRAAAAAAPVERARVAAEPDAVPAARVQIAAEALDRSRLTDATDLAGRDTHVRAVEMAGDQLARGEPVAVRVTPAADLIPARMEMGTSYEVALPKTGEPITFTRVREDTGEAVRPGYVMGDLEGTQAIVARDANGVEVGRILYANGSKAVEAEVAPDWRRKGIGTLLYDAAERHGADFSGDPAKLGTVSPDAMALRQYRAERAQRQEGPVRLADAAEQVRSALRPEAPTASTPKASAARTAEPAAAPAAAAEPAKPTTPTEPAAKSSEPPAAPPGAVDQVAALRPDMLVEIDGMPPMKVGDLLAKVREEAAQDAKSARLLEVAAECAIRSA